MATRVHRSGDLLNSVAFQLGFNAGGRLQLEVATFVHPVSASGVVTHEQVRKAVLAAVDEGAKVKCMVWRDGERADMHLIHTDTDFDLVCKYAREKTKRFPMFIVLMEKENVTPPPNVPPPTVPPPGGGPIIKT